MQQTTKKVQGINFNGMQYMLILCKLRVRVHFQMILNFVNLLVTNRKDTHRTSCKISQRCSPFGTACIIIAMHYCMHAYSTGTLQNEHIGVRTRKSSVGDQKQCIGYNHHGCSSWGYKISSLMLLSISCIEFLNQLTESNLEEWILHQKAKLFCYM